MYNLPKLENTKLKRDLSKQVPIVVKDLQSQQQKNIKLSVKENYVYKVWKAVNEIENKIKDLDACIILIKNYPKSKKLQKLFSREEYITYHLAYYYIGIVAVFDRALHLINIIDDIGLADKDVKVEIISTNAKVNNNTKKLLKSFNKSIGGIRSTQNIIKHKKQIWESTFRDIADFEHIYTNSSVIKTLSEKEKRTSKLLIKIKYKISVVNKCKELKNNNSILIKYIKVLYEVLYKKYNDNLEFLSNQIQNN